LGRRNKDLGTGKPKLQETSLPSLLMLIDRNVTETDDFQSIRPGTLIFTRSDRIRPSDFVAAQRAGLELVEIKPLAQEQFFKLYDLRSPAAANH